MNLRRRQYPKSESVDEGGPSPLYAILTTGQISRYGRVGGGRGAILTTGQISGYSRVEGGGG